MERKPIGLEVPHRAVVTGHTIKQPPAAVGFWWLDPNESNAGFRIGMYAKPTAAQIKNTEQMFGWKWVDA